jgi:hypothetical protein
MPIKVPNSYKQISENASNIFTAAANTSFKISQTYFIDARVSRQKSVMDAFIKNTNDSFSEFYPDLFKDSPSNSI